jgi:hypothetical protein
MQDDIRDRKDLIESHALNSRIISMCISSPKINITTYTLKKDPDSRLSKDWVDLFNNILRGSSCELSLLGN